MWVGFGKSGEMLTNLTTNLTVLVALVILGWGFYRARPYGKLGILSWVQSVTLMAPWLLFFGLFTAGISVNLLGNLLLFVIFTGIYVALGRQIRRIAPEELAKRADAIAKAHAENNPAESKLADPQGGEANSPQEPTPSAEATSPQKRTNVDANADSDVLIAIPAVDLQAIQGIFGIDTFFATQTIPFQEGVVFNGNLRGEPAVIHAKLSASLQERLGDRYRLFLVENQEGRPTVVLLTSRNDPQPLNRSQTLLAVTLLFGTIATCLETAGFLLGFDFYNNLQRYAEVLPISLGILSILVVHELGHWAIAQRYQVKLTLPFFFPTWQIGSFGGLTNFASLLPNRTTLFDIAFAGPATGGLLALVMLTIGLNLSHPGSAFKVPTVFFEGSILVGTLARIILGDGVKAALVEVHPLVILGWIGLVITAINLMPAGRLDGGRIVQAIYGRKMANRTTIATLVILGLASLINPLAIYWAVIIFFLQRNLERPSLDELTEPDDTRATLGLIALFLMVTVLLPLTPSFAGRLGFPV
ncbi:MAG: site-2 protease family protein [Synechococcales bacterium]|nr:site-2 protease family protein [Synechococcales bacterium]